MLPALRKTAIVLAIIMLFNVLGPATLYARTSEDIENEIKQKEIELQKINEELNNAQSVLNNSTAKKNSAQGRLSELEAEIEYIASQMEFNAVRTKVLQESLEIKKLEEEERNKRLDEQIIDSYLYWQSEGKYSYTTIFNSEDPVKTGTYYGMIAGNEKAGLEQLANELGQIEDDFNKFMNETQELEKQVVALAEEQKAKQDEINKINAAIQDEANKLSAAKSKSNKTKLQIDQLTEEQKALKEFEDLIVGGGGSGGTDPIVTGEFYFTGRGRDNVQGHGIGLSQNGALGAALAGWTYKQILQFYYPGTTVITYTVRTSIPVQGHGNMDLNTYGAGIGEVPSTGCENLGLAFGDRGYWGCWPKEAIKAQVVAARTYALTYTAGGSAICTSDVCQVYNGGNTKQWAADETSYEVVALSGAPIRAYYSAQNNQGGGTANNETIWSNREGNNTAYSYLRSVNDNGFYYPAVYSGCGNSDCAKWAYRTNSYTMDEIQSMLQWTAYTSTSVTQGDKDFTAGVLGSIGNLTSITFERDPSGRVHRVVLNGELGSRKVAGWFFKAIWNIWVGSVGQGDYIYSLTYYVLKG